MPVLKVLLEGPTASFRYPHFIQGVHPTFKMPPPATIYGLLCSVVGEFIGRDATRFAYHFGYLAAFEDYEHLHFFGRQPKMNPFVREMLFQPRLTLYLDNLDFEPFLRSPVYALSLGRSQDVMCITSVEQVNLKEDDHAFFDGTLLSLQDSALIGGQSYAVTMPRYINEAREPEWAQYAVLPQVERPIVYPEDRAMTFGAARRWQVDPTEPHLLRADIFRAVVWHHWRN